MKKTITKISAILSMIMCYTYLAAVQVHANYKFATPPPGKGTTGFENMLSGILEIIFIIIRVVGAVWAVMGFVKVVSSFKDDRPEDIKGGVASMAAGLCLVFAELVLQAIGILA